MIVWHGTTIDCLPGIRAIGLRAGSFVAPNRRLASDYAWHRAMTLGADSCVIFELDVPDAAVEEVEGWWWTGTQLRMPYGCPASCIIAVDDSDPQPFSTADG